MKKYEVYGRSRIETIPVRVNIEAMCHRDAADLFVQAADERATTALNHIDGTAFVFSVISDEELGEFPSLKLYVTEVEESTHNEDNNMEGDETFPGEKSWKTS